MEFWRLVFLLLSMIVFVDATATCGVCGSFAYCARNRKCTCRRRFVGDPKFACRPKNVYPCQIASDPELQTFDGQTSGIKIPAALFLTSLTTRRMAIGNGKCSFSLGAWTKRFDAKNFIEGIQFILKQTRADGVESTMKYRIIGYVKVNGEYEWLIQHEVRNDWKTIAVNDRSDVVRHKTCFGCRVYFIRTPEKFLLVILRCCRIHFGLRPFNPMNPKTVPGVWVNTPLWTHGFDPIPQNLCNSVKKSPNIDISAQAYAFKHKYQYTTFAGLAYGLPVDYPNVFPDLVPLQQTLKSCDRIKRSTFMKKADFLFTFGKLIKCLGDDIMKTVFEVVKGFCLNDSLSCSAAINRTMTTCQWLITKNRKLRSFLQKGC